jgi:hypothetical protein
VQKVDYKRANVRYSKCSQATFVIYGIFNDIHYDDEQVSDNVHHDHDFVCQQVAKIS